MPDIIEVGFEDHGLKDKATHTRKAASIIARQYRTSTEIPKAVLRRNFIFTLQFSYQKIQ